MYSQALIRTSSLEAAITASVTRPSSCCWPPRLLPEPR
jgi:hypothetical protein